MVGAVEYPDAYQLILADIPGLVASDARDRRYAKTHLPHQASPLLLTRPDDTAASPTPTPTARDDAADGVEWWNTDRVKRHTGKGVGRAFLRHVERAPVLIYVLDVSIGQPWRDVATLRQELELYQTGMSSRRSLIVANKVPLHVYATHRGALPPYSRRRCHVTC